MTDTTGGTKYALKRVKIEELQSKGFLDLLILHPAKPLNRLVLRPTDGDGRVMYELIIATTNARSVEDAIHKYMKSNSIEELTQYAVTTSPSRFKDRDLCIMYPASVRIATKLGVPFDYQAIIDSIPKTDYGMHYLSTPYNNGLYPVTNIWFEIPVYKKQERMDYIDKCRKGPELQYGMTVLDKVRKYDTTLMNELADSGVDLVYHIGANFADHTHLELDKISPEYSVCIKAMESLNRTNPAIPKVSVIGLDCVPMRDCAKYADLIDMGSYLEPDIYPPTLRQFSSSNIQPTPFNRTPPYIMASRIARLSGRFTFYKTTLDDTLMEFQSGRQDSKVSELKYLSNCLLVQKIRLVVNDNKEVVGEQASEQPAN